MEIYRNIAKNLLKRDKNEIKKKVIDIVKRNSKQNKKEISQHIMDLINVDNNFKQCILNQNSELLT